MGIVNFKKENIIDNRFILRANKSNTSCCYLSVFSVPKTSVIIFLEDSSKSIRTGLEQRALAESRNMKRHVAIDCTSFSKAQRLVNQSAWFLTTFPGDAYTHEVLGAKYNFSNAFTRRVYQISTDLVYDYLDMKLEETQQAMALFPENDPVMDWVRLYSYERNIAVERQELGENDLGISIYQCFSELDNLYVSKKQKKE